MGANGRMAEDAAQTSKPYVSPIDSDREIEFCIESGVESCKQFGFVNMNQANELITFIAAQLQTEKEPVDLLNRPFTETGLSPRALVEQRDMLLEALKEIRDTLNQESPENWEIEIFRMNQAINKVTQKP